MTAEGGKIPEGAVHGITSRPGGQRSLQRFARHTLLDFWTDDELQELEEIEATLPAEGRRPGDIVRVKLHARVTETGTLELEALPADGSARWKVQFDVRGDGSAGSDDAQAGVTAD